MKKEGFSLVELILAIVVLSIAISGTLTILGGMATQSHHAERQTLALEYGRMRMEQIMSKKFDESVSAAPPCGNRPPSNFGPDSGETETAFDDVDDFVTPPFDGEISTDPLAGRGFKTNVSVTYVTPNENSFGYLQTSSTATCYKRIAVEVVDVNTSQVLAKVRGVMTPFK